MQFPSSTKWSVISLLFITSIPVSILTYSNHKAGTEPMIAVANASARVTPTPTTQNNVEVQADPALAVTIETPAVEVESEDSRGSSQQEEIDSYIRTIFGKDAQVAIAVQRVECNPKNKAYPACRYTTSKEDSIGIFQINIQSQTAKVHFDRIPGSSLEEKVEWLKDPYNNTLMAYWIFSKSDWNPWAGYTSGRYLDHMAE